MCSVRGDMAQQETIHKNKGPDGAPPGLKILRLSDDTKGLHLLSHLMDLSVIARMDPAQLRSYVEFLLRNYRVMDAFWFIYTTEKSGQDTAEQINERVWGRVGGMSAKEIIDRFQIRESGLPGLKQALQYYPWSILIGYQIEQKGDELLLSVPSCPVQEARLKRGQKEYACRAMHEAEFVSFATAIDKRLCVECLFAPPAPHPAGMFCQWRFRVREAPSRTGA